MHRFFVEGQVEPGLLKQQGTSISLPDNLAHQVRDVLRLALNERLVLLDNSGEETHCAVRKSTRSEVIVEILERLRGVSESPVEITLCQGLLKSARFEWILEKGTELGVTTFAPTTCQRSMAGLSEAGNAKQKRWQRIIQEAAEQCGRSRIPTLQPIRPLMHMLADIPDGTLALMPWEEERKQTLRTTLREAMTNYDEAPTHHFRIMLFIGPEGGLTQEEIMMARRQGATIVTLGERILRAETAAIASIANIMYEVETTLKGKSLSTSLH
ncbi:16S rRNA (uracil(1498)-N(3))-methyltransferase [Ktedonospora formicarum]|uniref:Ribosomal RNA small subunit methyltransferase E n=1 Tax=Ktedonospora formicarum TaxID=2778364 RepID=A0A8J3I0V6_9CHLR|nr:16S rRNA (uracil(1498)-N(3))-methyltransferase [Ktedonospora formicarum]GHO44745.1 16S rRNA (uracil(1498)-N(3))-methyltransferase [Ktedonospora formicarum]